jgi:hypothetical protein
VAPFLVYLTRQNGNTASNDSKAVAVKTENNPETTIGKP